MKKSIALAVIVLSLSFAVPVYGQVSPAPAPTLQEQINEAVRVLGLLEQIQKLQATVDSLIVQLKALQVSHDAVAAQVTQIVQNTTPVAPVFGSTITPQSAIIVPMTTPEIKKELKFSTLYPGKYFNFNVSYAENGTKKCGTPITLNAQGGYFSYLGPSELLITVDTATGEAGDPRGMFKNGLTMKTRCWGDTSEALVQVAYHPDVNSTEGTITATADGVSATTTYQVQ